MQLYYYNEESNFGDELNVWLWPRLIADFEELGGDRRFCGIGTLIDEKLPREQLSIFGSGVGYGEVPELHDSWQVFFVRGPRSAEQLGFSPEMAITDPAVLVREFYEPEAGTPDFEYGYMPHHRSKDQDLIHRLCDETGIRYISPSRPVEDVFDDICRCRTLVTEALHGAIVADSFGIPWLPVQFNSQVLPFKWHDWCASMGLEYQPLGWSRSIGYPWKLAKRGPLSRPAWSAFRIAFKRKIDVHPRFLSDRKVVDKAIKRIREKAAELETFILAN